ncbi:uL30 family ribosomal protein [Candidatus Woesearchaeota archaeon]|nr:uL30 family ribosomal protein [Candidatus Woesearchaeota archaeon]
MTEETKKTESAGGQYAAILIRNTTRTSGDIRDTLIMLRLHKKFTCTLVPAIPSFKGMLNKTKDFIAYGEVDDETVKLLNEKRGNDDNLFHLHPPRGGFERKGIKRNFVQGGAIGYRGTKINDLIKRMI